MTPSDLHALARVLDALLPHRTVGQLADDPQEAHARAAAAAPRPAGAPPTRARLGPALAGPAAFFRPGKNSLRQRGRFCQGW